MVGSTETPAGHSPDHRAPLILVTTWRRHGTVWDDWAGELVGVEAEYLDALLRAGGQPVIVPTAAPTASGADLAALLQMADGLLVIGGEDVAAEVSGADSSVVVGTVDADRDRREIELVHAALAANKPVLGICRGLQLLNVALGGTLYGDIAGQYAEHPQVPSDMTEALAYRHDVVLDPDSRLAGIYDVTTKSVNSMHHQSIDRLGDGLTVTGRASDGVIEAAELPSARWCVGVQWHPEMLADDPLESSLFAAFVKECAA